MYCGKIVETGDMDDIINNPRHPYTQGLISSVVSYDPKGRVKGELKSIPGEHPDLRNPPPGCRFHPRCPLATDVCKTKELPVIKAEKGKRECCCCL
jgi:oligopeptide/dipeptide ABC transporter ATP-binding protein